MTSLTWLYLWYDYIFILSYYAFNVHKNPLLLYLIYDTFIKCPVYGNSWTALHFLFIIFDMLGKAFKFDPRQLQYCLLFFGIMQRRIVADVAGQHIMLTLYLIWSMLYNPGRQVAI